MRQNLGMTFSPAIKPESFMTLRFVGSFRYALVVFAAFIIVAVVISAFALEQVLSSEDVKRTNRETEHFARTLTAHAEESFRGVDLTLRDVQDRLHEPFGFEQPLDGVAANLLLHTRLSGLPYVAALFIVDRDGKVANSTRSAPFQPFPIEELQRYDAFVNKEADTLFIGGPMHDLESGKWMLYLGRRLHDGRNRFRGVVMAALTLSYFEQMYDDLAPEFMHRAALYLSDGRLIASQPPRTAEIGQFAAELRGIVQTPPAPDAPPVADLAQATHAEFVLGRIADYPFLVSVGYERKERLAAARKRALPIIAGASLFCLFIVVATALLIRKLRREEVLTQALRAAGDRSRQMIDSAMDAIISIDASQAIIMVNNAAECMFGIRAADTLGCPFSSLISAPLRDAQSERIAGYLDSHPSSATIAHMELTGLRADGVEFPVEATFSPMRIEEQPQLTIALRDITERRRREDEVRLMNEELRFLSSSLQSVRDQERIHLSRELHDELGQQLTGLKLDLSWLTSSLKAGRAPKLGRLDAMRAALDDAIATVRRIATELRPPVLDDLAFGDAVAWHAAEFTRRSGIEVTLNLAADAQVSDAGMATTLFRIVQESLTNVARHAGATRVDISLHTDGDWLVLRVRDNGNGFESAGAGKGIGLLSMRERAAALAGHFRVVSEWGEGSAIEVRVPKEPHTLRRKGADEAIGDHDRRRSLAHQECAV